MSGFTPILRVLTDPNVSWTGFSYQGLINKIVAYTLADLDSATPPAKLQRLGDQALSSLENAAEFPDLREVEAEGDARLATVLRLFRQALNAADASRRHQFLRATLNEAAYLNTQSHDWIHVIQAAHAAQLVRLRAVLLFAALLSGVLSAVLILRALRLWRQQKSAFDGQQELLSLASHELRRPLQALLIAADLLPEASAEERLRLLRVVEENALQVASRADLQRLDAMYSKVELEWEAVCVGALLLSFAGPRTHVEVPAEEVQVSADPRRLRQVIENLHENALRYSSGPVTLRCVPGDGWVEVQVQDEGEGIDPGEVERLFRPRERGRGQGRPGEGLGLTVARRLADAHGAQLELLGAPGGGTLAVLRLQR
ncbi:sensor histidine kinase [Deinococcus aquiradiocola]|nr:HAMP domain-containing sensor histidine kinase [Deinococcus aquiradiocola]